MHVWRAGAYFPNIEGALKYYPQWKAAYEFYRKHGGGINLSAGSSFFVPSESLELFELLAGTYLVYIARVLYSMHVAGHSQRSYMLCVGDLVAHVTPGQRCA